MLAVECPADAAHKKHKSMVTRDSLKVSYTQPEPDEASDSM